MDNLKFTGRRVPKGFSLPLDLVELIERRAKEAGIEQSVVALDLFLKGLKAEALGEESEPSGSPEEREAGREGKDALG